MSSALFGSKLPPKPGVNLESVREASECRWTCVDVPLWRFCLVKIAVLAAGLARLTTCRALRAVYKSDSELQVLSCQTACAGINWHGVAI